MDDHNQSLLKNWKLLAEGEKQGLYACFSLFYDDLYRFGLSLYHNPELIKESIQNLFIELWQIRHKLAEVDNIQQYVLTIYKRIIYKTNQKTGLKSIAQDISLEDLKPESISVGSYESILIASQEDDHLKKRLFHALGKLTPRQKEMVQMRYFDCLSFKEIAGKTQLTERTIYNTLHSAVNVLRESLMTITIAVLFAILAA
ncbi:MAG TPA: sigma-70 family RNA polymerase sigma factor [Pedobacter sp.]|nr:sigma-70 family RNA polymerase sigma factor [Pedobacter sp.]